MKRIITLILMSVLLISQIPCAASTDERGKVYYISNSGSDENDGLSEEKPLKTFKRLGEKQILPGDKILLKCGDVWFEELVLEGIRGEKGNSIEIASYSDGEKPIIDGGGKKERVGIYINDPSNITVRDLLIRNCGIGVCMQYFNTGRAENLIFRNLDFINVQGRNKFTPVDADKKALGFYSRSSGIQIYGELMGDEKLNNVLIDNCHANYGDMLVYMDINESQGKGIQPIENLLIKDSSAQNFTTFGMQINGVKHGVIESCVIKHGRAMDYPHGLTAILLGATKHFYIRNCEIAYMGRYRDNPDGSGIDFERNNVDAHVENCSIHHCEGYSITFYYNNENCTVTNNTFLMNNRSSVFTRDIHIFDTAEDNIQHDIVVANNKYLVPATVTEFADINNASRVYNNEVLTPADGDVLISDDFELEAVGDVPRAWDTEHKAGFIRISDTRDINDKSVRMVKNAAKGEVSIRKMSPAVNGVITATQFVQLNGGNGYVPMLADEEGQLIAGAYTFDGKMQLITNKETVETNENIKGNRHMIRLMVDTVKCTAKLYIDEHLAAEAEISDGKSVKEYKNTISGDGMECEVFLDKLKLICGEASYENDGFTKAFAFDAAEELPEGEEFEQVKAKPVMKNGIRIGDKKEYKVDFDTVTGEVIIRQTVAEAKEGKISVKSATGAAAIGVQFSEKGIYDLNTKERLGDMPENVFTAELIINLKKQRMTVVIDGKTVGKTVALSGRTTGIDSVVYSGDFVLDEFSVKKLKFYKRELYEDIEVGEAPADWILKNDVNARGEVYKKHEDGRNYLMFKNTRTVPASSASTYKYITSPLSGKISFSMKICPENVRYGRNVYMYTPENKPVFSWNFSEGRNMITIDGSWEQVGKYVAGRWYDLSIVADTDTQKCTVYLDGKLYADNIPFRNPTDRIGIFQIHWGNYEGGIMDFTDVEIMNYETIAENGFEDGNDSTEFVYEYTPAVRANTDCAKMMFEPQTGIVMTQQYVSGEGEIAILGRCEMPMVALKIRDSELLYEKNGVFVPLGIVDGDSVNDLRIIADTHKRHFSVFINGEIMAAKLPIESEIQTVSGIGFGGDLNIYSAKVIRYVSGVPIYIYDDYEANQNNIWLEQ